MKFNEVLEKMREIYDAKNHDYSGGDPFGNFKECERIGVPAWKGAFIRLQDKYSRLCNLIRIGEDCRKVMDEKIEDTLLDLANYAVIVLCLLSQAIPKREMLRPGDKVKVKIFEELEKMGEYVDITKSTLRVPGKYAFMRDMRRFCGKEVTIDKVIDEENTYFRIKEDEGVWIWSKCMFDLEEGENEEQENEDEDENDKCNLAKLKEQFEGLRETLNIKRQKENERR